MLKQKDGRGRDTIHEERPHLTTFQSSPPSPIFCFNKYCYEKSKNLYVLIINNDNILKLKIKILIRFCFRFFERNFLQNNYVLYYAEKMN